MSALLQSASAWLKAIGYHTLMIGLMAPQYRKLSDTYGVVFSFALAAAAGTVFRLWGDGENNMTAGALAFSIVAYLVIIGLLSLRKGQSKVLFAVLLGTSAWIDTVYTAARMLAMALGESGQAILPASLVLELAIVYRALMTFYVLPSNIKAAGYRAGDSS